MSTCFCKCSKMLQWSAKVPMNMQFAGAEEGHCLSGTFWQNLLPWSSSMMTPGIKTSKPCTMMSNYYADCLAEAGAKSRGQSSFARRSWLPSRSTSGFSSQPSSRWDSRHSSQPKIPDMILPQLSPLSTKRPMRRWWHLWGRPNNEPLLWLWSSRRGWVTPLTANAPPTSNALPATRGPNPLDSREKVPGWLHTIGELRLDRGVPRWPHAMGELKETERYPNFMPEGCHEGRMNHVTQLHKMETSGDIHQRKGHGRQVSSRPMQHHRRWWIRHDDRGGPTPPAEDEEVDLKHSLQLNPHLQWLLEQEEPTLAGTDAGDSLLPLPSLMPLSSPSLPPLPSPEDPQPSPLHSAKWIEWCAKYIQTPSWWEELTQVPGHTDYQEFTQKVHASFEVPAACNWVKKVENNCTPPPAHPSIVKHHFLLPRDGRFASHGICLGQVQHTVAYMMALQYWAKWVHPPIPGQPRQLAESMQELWQVMEPLVSFGEEEVFATMALSNWMEVTPPWSMETMLQPPQESQKHHTCNTKALTRRSMTANWGEGRLAATTTQATAATEAPVTPITGV